MTPPRRRQARPPNSLPPLSRDTFDVHWLRTGTTTCAYHQFQHHPLEESAGSRERIRDFLSQAIVDHHFHRRRVADRLADLGHSRAADFIASQLPQDDRTRKGNFGEVVTSEHLIQRYGYEMPVFKIRFRDSYDLPMRGEDIVAFEVDTSNRITKVIIGEAKTVVRFRRRTVQEAHERLVSAYHPHPVTLSLLAEILYEAGNNLLGQEIDRIISHLIRRGFPRENWIFLITQSRPDDIFGCIDDNGPVVPNLHCAGLSLDALSAFVNHLFDSPSLRS